MKIRKTIPAYIILFLFITVSVSIASTKTLIYRWKKGEKIERTVTDIPLPKEYTRIDVAQNSFGNWLRGVPLKPEGAKVHYYNGRQKWTQTVHFAVIDMDVGKRDRQQCADAVMRLRAEYLYSIGKAHRVCFKSVSRKNMCYRDYKKIGFRRYLSNVFAFANTRSLFREVKTPKDKDTILPGDIFIEPATGGRYGHAVIVMDVAKDSDGNQIFLLAQSYMPAQEMHILKNPNNKNLSPWYTFDSTKSLITPEWRFSANLHRRF